MQCQGLTLPVWNALLRSVIFPPAASYSELGKLASLPAFSSMLTLNPFLTKTAVADGVMATLKLFPYPHTDMRLD